MHSIVMPGSAEIVAVEDASGWDDGSRRLAALAVASLVLLVLGGGLLWIAQADAVFLHILSAGLPGCY